MSENPSIPALGRFAKAKKLAKPGRVSGGGSRAVYYENPDQVQVIRGKTVNGSRTPRSQRG
jgi:hypothetical protein